MCSHTTGKIIHYHTSFFNWNLDLAAVIITLYEYVLIGTLTNYYEYLTQMKEAIVLVLVTEILPGR